MDNFQEDLIVLKKQMATALPSEVQTIFETSLAEVKALDLEKKSLQVGEFFPTFNLSTSQGGRVLSSDLLLQGEVVVAFIRGSWCPYCQLQMKVMQEVAIWLKTKGMTLVVVTPEQATPMNPLPFVLVSDPENSLAKAIGISFTLPKEVCSVYAQLGVKFTDASQGMATLPLPAVYRLDPKGRVVFRYVEADYTQRIVWKDVMKA